MNCNLFGVLFSDHIIICFCGLLVFVITENVIFLIFYIIGKILLIYVGVLVIMRIFVSNKIGALKMCRNGDAQTCIKIGFCGKISIVRGIGFW